MGVLSEEIAKVLHRKRRNHRYTQADLGALIGVSGSYISTLENGRASPRLSELEALATHFRTTALDLIEEAARGGEAFIPAAPDAHLDLDEIASSLSPEDRALARDFLLLLRDRGLVDSDPSS